MSEHDGYDGVSGQTVSDDEILKEIQANQKRNNDLIMLIWGRYARDVVNQVVNRLRRIKGIKITEEDQDVKDIMSDITMRIITSLYKFKIEHERKNFAGWLATIARNCVKDRFTRPKSAPAALPPGGTVDATSQCPADAAECAELNAELGCFPDFLRRMERSTLQMLAVCEKADGYPGPRGRGRVSKGAERYYAIEELCDAIRKVLGLTEEAGGPPQSIVLARHEAVLSKN